MTPRSGRQCIAVAAGTGVAEDMLEENEMKKKSQDRSGRVFGRRHYGIDTARADDWSLPRPGKRSQALERKMIEALEEATEEGCDRDLPGLCSCIRYARDNMKGEWGDLEDVLFERVDSCSQFEPLMMYVTNVLKKRSVSLEESFFEDPYRLTDHFAEYVRMGLVPHDDTQFVNELLSLAITNEWAMTVAIVFADTMFQGKWPGKWPALGALIESWQYSPLNTVGYCLVSRGTRWPELEKAVNSRPLDDDWARGVMIEYAAAVMEGRWEKQEARLESSAYHLFKYADRALKKQLPDHLHSRMTMDVWPTKQTQWVEKYSETYGLCPRR